MNGLLAFLLLASPAWGAKEEIVVMSDAGDPVSLDPHREFDASSDNIVNQVFDGLVRLSPDGRVEPALAESWRRVDDNTLEFDLRPGVTFHDGEPFDAEAVRFSLARQLDPARPAPNAGLLAPLYEAEVVSPLRVRLRTRRPDGVLLNKLPMFFKILPPGYLKKAGDEGFALHPVGTGPYEFVRWEKGREIVLRSVPGHWSKARSVKNLRFRFVPRERQLAMLFSGEADMISDLSGLDTRRVAANPAFRVVKAKGFYTVSLLFNSLHSPFDDERVRRAAALAVDARELVRYGAMGNAEPLRSLTLPGQFGFDPLAEGHAYDLAGARALLGGRRLPLKVLAREEVTAFAKVIVRQLSEAGFSVTLSTGTQETVYNAVVRPNLDPALPPWDGDLVITHYVDPTAHAYFPYSILVHSKGPYSMVRDAEFDALFERMVATLEREPQRELCRRLEEVVRRKVLAVSEVQVIRPIALRRGLRYEPQLTGMLDFRGAHWEDGHDDDR